MYVKNMNPLLPFFNWSLKKALDTESDSFIKARIRILYTILLFSILKVLIAIGFSTVNEQWLQTIRAIIAFVLYVALTKILLYMPSRLTLLAHIMLQIGTLIVWTNIFIYAHKINLVSIQFVAMIMLSSFYTLGSRWGIIYSVVGVAPVILFLVSGGNSNIYFDNTPQEFASPGYEIIVILNFISIIVSHYLFYEAFHVNIRDKERLNQQLQLSIAEAEELASSKSNFLSTMSHELRTPLNSVVGTTELLLDDNPEERQKENLKILQVSANDLLSLINNILDFNKLDSEKLVLERVDFQLTEFIQNICSGLKLKAIDKQLDFVVDIDPELEKINIISDPTRLSQLMYNLVSNAIKFTDKGSVAVKLKCIHKTASNVEVLFSVTDTGIGIHPDRHEAIFELFAQAESHTTRKYGGTGLGLAIVKQILALFDSSLHLKSSPGNGSTFFFTLHFTRGAEMLLIETTSVTEKTDISHLKILVAEDNDVNRLLMKKQLDKLNVQSLMVENGKLAFEACLADDYDAIFMDLHMPELNGYEAMKQIREIADPLKAKVYIIAFTASVTEQQEIVKAGFNDFLYKPVNMKDLHNKLDKVAEHKATGI